MILTGYEFSVYTRAARIAFELKRTAYTYKECDPFDPDGAKQLLNIHPFARVPVLQHDEFALFETQAILGYIDSVLDGPDLAPQSAQSKARMRQVMCIVDNYLYWPLVRQVFSNGVFARLIDEPVDQAALAQGLTKSPAVLRALEDIAQEGLILAGEVTQADCLLWPMIDYFRMIPEGDALFRQHKALVRWSEMFAADPAVVATKPNLSDLTDRGLP